MDGTSDIIVSSTFRDELHFGRTEWVLVRNNNIDMESSASVRSVGRARDGLQEYKKFIAL